MVIAGPTVWRAGGGCGAEMLGSVSSLKVGVRFNRYKLPTTTMNT